MRTTLATLALLPLLALPSLAETRVVEIGAQEVGTQTPRERFDKAVEQLRLAAVERKATREDYQRVLDALTATAQSYGTQSPAATSLRDRLAARIQELEARAEKAALETDDLDIVRDLMIDMHLEFALARLQAHAVAGKWAREDYDAVANALTARANHAKAWNPEIEGITKRLMAAIDALMERARAATLQPADFRLADSIATEARLSMALKRLEKRAHAKKVTPSDSADVFDAARRMRPSDETALADVKAKLDAIESAVKTGKSIDAHYSALRELTMKKAQEASYKIDSSR